MRKEVKQAELVGGCGTMELTAEKWVEKLNQLSKKAKQEIGDERS